MTIVSPFPPRRMVASAVNPLTFLIRGVGVQFVDPAAGIRFPACSEPMRGVFAAGGGGVGFRECVSSAVAFVETIAY